MSLKIIDAVRNSQYSQLLLFMRHNYNFRIKTIPDSQNILMISLEIEDPKRRFKMFNFLLKHDLVDVSQTDCLGQNIFFKCVLKECERELALLMKNCHAELDWTRTDNTGKTVLHYAVLTNNLVILEILLTYSAKFKINIDIPDKVNRITPYLLACRMNYTKSADLLVDLGHASKNQIDQCLYLDAETWKKEGQKELVKNYLKLKEEEMNIAKLKGNIKTYKELCSLSQSLDYEVDNNPEILPVLAKVIIEHDTKGNKCLPEKKNITMPLIKTSKSIDFSYLYPRSNLKSLSSNSSNMNSSSFSSHSSSAFSNYNNTNNLHLILKQTMNDEARKRNAEIAQFNSLLEMTNGHQVEQFVGSSKLEFDSKSDSGASSNYQSNASHHNHDNHHHHHQHHHNNLELSDMFLAVSLQNTNNYRKTVKYVPDIPKFLQKRDSKKKQSVKPKSNLSTFKLITIQEESKRLNKIKPIIKAKN